MNIHFIFLIPFSSSGHVRADFRDQVLNATAANAWINASDTAANGISIFFQTELKSDLPMRTFHPVQEQKR